MLQHTCPYAPKRQDRGDQRNRAMTVPKPNEEVRNYLAAIGAKGGKTVTPKKVAHLASIAAKGGQTVTAKKREHLRKALAIRWAKARAKSRNT